MTYFNLFPQMNFSLGFLTGNCLSNWLGNKLFGGWNSMPMTMPGNMYMYTYYPASSMNIFSTPDTGQFNFTAPDYTNMQLSVPQFEFNSIWNNNNTCTYSVPQFNFTTPNFCFNNFQYYGGINNYSTGVVDEFVQRTEKSRQSVARSGNYHLYATLTRDQALARARNDSNLECLEGGGNGWSLASGSFITDIPYAKRGTKALLDRVRRETGIDFIVTSALGTAGTGNQKSPHGYRDSSKYFSHFNSSNPKLDIQPALNPGDREANQRLADALNRTGLFTQKIVPEYVAPTGKYHLDLQFKDSAYTTV